MRFTEAQRAEIIAGMRKLRAEGKDRVHVISSRGGWRVFREETAYRDGTRGSGRVFKTKDEAVTYGRDRARRLRSELVVHTREGGLESWESFSETAASQGGSGL